MLTLALLLIAGPSLGAARTDLVDDRASPPPAPPAPAAEPKPVIDASLAYAAAGCAAGTCATVGCTACAISGIAGCGAPALAVPLLDILFLGAQVAAGTAAAAAGGAAIGPIASTAATVGGAVGAAQEGKSPAPRIWAAVPGLVVAAASTTGVVIGGAILTSPLWGSPQSSAAEKASINDGLTIMTLSALVGAAAGPIALAGVAAADALDAP